MKTMEIPSAGGYNNIEEARKAFAAMIAGTIVLGQVSKDEREEFDDLANDLMNCESPDERIEIVKTIAEILCLPPKGARRMAPSPERRPVQLQRWIAWISKTIRNCRDEAGLTQSELADLSELPQSHISRIETGQLSPSRKTLEKLAKGLGVPVSKFEF